MYFIWIWIVCNFKFIAHQEIDDNFKEEIKEQSRGSFTKNVNSWMSKLGKIGTSTVTIMKTYMNQKDSNEHEFKEFEDQNEGEEEEVERFNAESTDISNKTDSECTPQKENGQEPKGEIPCSDLLGIDAPESSNDIVLIEHNPNQNQDKSD